MSAQMRECSPGDWRVERSEHEIEPAYTVKAGDRSIAGVCTNAADPDADAQVMAASKALYLALQVCLRVAERAAFAAAERTDRDVAWLAAEAARAALALVERRV